MEQIAQWVYFQRRYGLFLKRIHLFRSFRASAVRPIHRTAGIHWRDGVDGWPGIVRTVFCAIG